MKAIVMFQKSGIPQYVDNFPEPTITERDQLIVNVKAAAIKHLDKGRATGSHYSTKGDISAAKVIGVDGAGVLEDGTKVFGLGVTGMMAERAVVEKSKMVIIPEGLDMAVAAALPNAVSGSAMALRYRGEMKGGETVLINGATGRNEQSLQYLRQLGADEIIRIQQDDDSFKAAIKEIHQTTPFDIVVDYLWGHSAELILDALKGQGNFTHRTRYVSVGSMAGDKIQLSSEILRGTDLHLTGSGMGSWTKEEIKVLLSEIIPEMYQLVIKEKLKVDVQTITLEDIQSNWDVKVEDGKRLVALL